MKLKRTKSRTYKGRDYYRWTVQIHPSDIRKLGWGEGDFLVADVRGETLRIKQRSRR